MNHSGATGVPHATGLRRAHWLALGGVLLLLALVGSALLYLSPVPALLDSRGPVAGKPGAAVAATPPPLDDKQRINSLILGRHKHEKFS